MEQLLKINQLTIDQEKYEQIDHNVLWLAKILEELQDHTDPEGDVSHPSETSFLEAKLKLLKKKSNALKDHLIIRGTVNTSYHTQCVRCLAPARETLKVDFSACFLHHSFKQQEEYHDITDIFCDGELMELYFYNKNAVDLYEYIHEQIFLNVNQRPLHNTDCKGLCPICGFNLNLGKCIHARK
ncbi:MAG: DUF177 domain-containing protein [Bacteriovoracaceae bacterium]|nr:DUF177 domain-containing protein [Bacteriovoracaceae bacterium]